MKKTYRSYNHKLSEKVNAQLDRRAQVVYVQKKLIAIISIIVVSLAVLLGTGICVFANSEKDNRPVYKYYTSVQVTSGDTVWDMADRYIEGYDINKDAYVQEICELNHLQDGQIHSGDHLVMAYYSHDEK